MDPSVDFSDDEAYAMAKAMGFSSFGAQNQTKKRKFNPKTDAVVEGEALAVLDKGGKKGQGSGGNQIPLGKARVFGLKEVASHDGEIEITGDGDEGSEGEPAYIDTSLTPPAESKPGMSRKEKESSSLEEESRAAQDKINAIVARNADLPKPVFKSSDIQLPGEGGGHFLAISHHHLPLKPSWSSPGTTSITNSQRDVSAFSQLAPGASIQREPVKNSQRPKEKKQKNELWYVGYYDPGFNRNPWAKLEMANGLQPRGTWVDPER